MRKTKGVSQTVPPMAAAVVPAASQRASVQVFDSPEFGRIRTTVINGEPWFVLKDVCGAFGDVNYRRVSSRIDEDEKGVSQITTPGGAQKMTVVNESGLYSALFLMQPQKARGVTQEYVDKRMQQLRIFRRWVTSKVLPSIRKTGSYTAPMSKATMPEIPRDYPSALRALADQFEERAALEAKIEVDRPKVEFATRVSNYTGTISVGDFAKLLSKDGFMIGRNKLYAWMRSNGILDKNNVPYQAHMEAGYLQLIEVTKYGYPRPAVRITGKGQLWLYKKIASVGATASM